MANKYAVYRYDRQSGLGGGVFRSHHLSSVVVDTIAFNVELICVTNSLPCIVRRVTRSIVPRMSIRTFCLNAFNLRYFEFKSPKVLFQQINFNQICNKGVCFIDEVNSMPLCGCVIRTYPATHSGVGRRGFREGSRTPESSRNIFVTRKNKKMNPQF